MIQITNKLALLILAKRMIMFIIHAHITRTTLLQLSQLQLQLLLLQLLRQLLLLPLPLLSAGIPRVFLHLFCKTTSWN